MSEFREIFWLASLGFPEEHTGNKNIVNLANYCHKSSNLARLNVD